MSLGETVTVIPRESAGLDPYGNETMIDGATKVLHGAAFDPGGSTEPVERGRRPVVTTPKLFFRAVTAIGEPDRVIVRGETYEVVGQPQVWRSPNSGALAGVVVDLRAVTG